MQLQTVVYMAVDLLEKYTFIVLYTDQISQ